MTTTAPSHRSCQHCGTPLASDANPRTVVCSGTCRARVYRARQRQRKAQRHGSTATARPRRCRVCDQEFINVRETRVDAYYCSGACRTRAYRARKAGHDPSPLTPRPDVRPLPIPLRPADHETVASYVRRLAEANHVPDRELLRHFQASLGPYSTVNIDRLAAGTGMPAAALRLALPELRNLRERTLAVKSGHEVDLSINQIRPACRRCTAGHAGGRVEHWQAPEINVCLRHRLWIGSGVDHPAQQLDIACLPEVVDAQRRHLNLLRRHGRQRATTAHDEASQICWPWQDCREHQQHSQRRLRTLANTRPHDNAHHPSLVHAAIYPEVVALTSLLAADYWRLLAGSADADERHQFRREASRRIEQPYRSRSLDDPIERWMLEQRRVTISPHAVE